MYSTIENGNSNITPKASVNQNFRGISPQPKMDQLLLSDMRNPLLTPFWLGGEFPEMVCHRFYMQKGRFVPNLKKARLHLYY